MFQSTCGVNVDHFLEFLAIYLKNTFPSFEGELFVQKKEICNSLLSRCGRNVYDKLREQGSFKVFRYVDEFLVLSKTTTAASGEIQKY